MDNDCPDPSLYERIQLLERLIKGQAEQLEAFRLRAEAANQRAELAGELLARMRAEQIMAGSGTGPLPAAPPPVPRLRAARHRSPLPPGERWLRVVRLAAPAAALALAGILAGFLPLVRADDTPVRASVTPHALCDPPGFAPPSSDGIWQLDMKRGSGPCIQQPPPLLPGVGH